jgi:anti-sigma factor RsiW
MNCRRCQHELYEYLDGSLSTREQAAMEIHLAGCSACRQALNQERQISRSLLNQLNGAAQSLQLPPQVRHKVIATLADERRARDEGRGDAFFWRRLAWPLAAAAAGLMLLAGVFYSARVPGRGTVQPHPHLAAAGVSVQLSYVVPTYTFRREGGFVVDALTCQTNVVDQRLASLPAHRE